MVIDLFGESLPRAIFVGKTFVAGKLKYRWECPLCRAAGGSECRFNLSADKDGVVHKCRFCGSELLLVVPDVC